MKVAVVIATFGDDPMWEQLATRAVQSLAAQVSSPDYIVKVHGRTLATARNDGARQAMDATHLIFLDGDDTLDPFYVRAMREVDPDIDIVQPATIGVYEDGSRDAEPVMIPAHHSLREGNWIVIGARVRADQFWAVNGFKEWEAYEDWDLWGRMHFHAGATIGAQPEAIYEVHVREGSRNQTITNPRQLFSDIVTSWGS